MISINICRAEALRREGIHVLLMEYNTLCFPLLNCQEKLSDSSIIRAAEKSATGKRVKVTAQDHIRPSSSKTTKGVEGHPLLDSEMDGRGPHGATVGSGAVLLQPCLPFLPFFPVRVIHCASIQTLPLPWNPPFGSESTHSMSTINNASCQQGIELRVQTQRQRHKTVFKLMVSGVVSPGNK